jgi:hypothetical protein
MIKDQESIDDAYDRGFIDGLIAFAHWNDGKQLVGTTGTTLKAAIENRISLWNYAGDKINGR